MGKKNFKEMIANNQRYNHINPLKIRLNQNIEETENQNNKKSIKSNKMKNNKSIVAMAIAKGREISDSTNFKRYIGVASCKIVAINPSKEALETIYGRPNDKEVNYLGESEVNGVKVAQARIDILFKLNEKYLDDTGNPINTIFRKSIFLNNTPVTNRDVTKYQVVDEYGNTAWVTKEQLDNHEVPMYSNGPASITKNYRPLYRGEETLMNIIKVFLRIPTTRIDANQNPMRYNNASKSWEIVKDASDGLIRFDTIKDFFKGDFKEIQEIPSFQPKNTVKILFGVKSVDGRMYQDIFDTVISSNSIDYTRLENALNESKNNGGYPNTEFKVCEFQEYNVTPTSFTDNTPSSNPFNSADDIF